MRRSTPRQLSRLRRPTRSRRAPALAPSSLASLALLASFASPAFASPSPAAPRAHRSAALRARDAAHLHYVSAKGSLLLDEGTATGTVPGRMKVRLRIGATFTGSFTLYASGGAIFGHGSAVAHGAGTYESFAGSLTATGGSGRYKRAHGRAQLYGVFNRSDYSLVIQTSGTLHY